MSTRGFNLDLTSPTNKLHNLRSPFGSPPPNSLGSVASNSVRAVSVSSNSKPIKLKTRNSQHKFSQPHLPRPRQSIPSKKKGTLNIQFSFSPNALASTRTPNRSSHRPLSSKASVGNLSRGSRGRSPLQIPFQETGSRKTISKGITKTDISKRVRNLNKEADEEWYNGQTNTNSKKGPQKKVSKESDLEFIRRFKGNITNDPLTSIRKNLPDYGSSNQEYIDPNSSFNDIKLNFEDADEGVTDFTIEPSQHLSRRTRAGSLNGRVSYRSPPTNSFLTHKVSNVPLVVPSNILNQKRVTDLESTINVKNDLIINLQNQLTFKDNDLKDLGMRYDYVVFQKFKQDKRISEQNQLQSKQMADLKEKENFEYEERLKRITQDLIAAKLETKSVKSINFNLEQKLRKENVQHLQQLEDSLRGQLNNKINEARNLAEDKHKIQKEMGFKFDFEASRNIQLQKELKDTKVDLDRARGDLRKQRELEQGLSQQLDRNQRLVSSQKQTILAMEKNSEKLETEISDLKAALNNSSASLNYKLKETGQKKEKEIRSLMDKIIALDMELKNEKSGTNHLLQSMKGKVAVHKKELEEKSGQINHQMKQIDNLEMHLREKLSVIQELVYKQRQMEEQINQLKRPCSDCMVNQQQLNQQEQQLQKLQQEYQQQQQQFQQQQQSQQQQIKVQYRSPTSPPQQQQFIKESTSPYRREIATLKEQLQHFRIQNSGTQQELQDLRSKVLRQSKTIQENQALKNIQSLQNTSYSTNTTSNMNRNGQSITINARTPVENNDLGPKSSEVTSFGLRRSTTKPNLSPNGKNRNNQPLNQLEQIVIRSVTQPRSYSQNSKNSKPGNNVSPQKTRGSSIHNIINSPSSNKTFVNSVSSSSQKTLKILAGVTKKPYRQVKRMKSPQIVCVIDPIFGEKTEEAQSRPYMRIIEEVTAESIDSIPVSDQLEKPSASCSSSEPYQEGNMQQQQEGGEGDEEYLITRSLFFRKDTGDSEQPIIYSSMVEEERRGQIVNINAFFKGKDCVRETESRVEESEEYEQDSYEDDEDDEDEEEENDSEYSEEGEDDRERQNIQQGVEIVNSSVVFQQENQNHHEDKEEHTFGIQENQTTANNNLEDDDEYKVMEFEVGYQQEPAYTSELSYKDQENASISHSDSSSDPQENDHSDTDQNQEQEFISYIDQGHSLEYTQESSQQQDFSHLEENIQNSNKKCYESGEIGLAMNQLNISTRDQEGEEDVYEEGYSRPSTYVSDSAISSPNAETEKHAVPESQSPINQDPISEFGSEERRCRGFTFSSKNSEFIEEKVISTKSLKTSSLADKEIKLSNNDPLTVYNSITGTPEVAEIHPIPETEEIKIVEIGQDEKQPQTTPINPYIPQLPLFKLQKPDRSCDTPGFDLKLGPKKGLFEEGIGFNSIDSDSKDAKERLQLIEEAESSERKPLFVEPQTTNYNLRNGSDQDEDEEDDTYQYELEPAPHAFMKSDVVLASESQLGQGRTFKSVKPVQVNTETNTLTKSILEPNSDNNRKVKQLTIDIENLKEENSRALKAQAQLYQDLLNKNMTKMMEMLQGREITQPQAPQRITHSPDQSFENTTAKKNRRGAGGQRGQMVVHQISQQETEKDRGEYQQTQNVAVNIQRHSFGPQDSDDQVGTLVYTQNEYQVQREDYNDDEDNDDTIYFDLKSYNQQQKSKKEKKLRRGNSDSENKTINQKKGEIISVGNQDNSAQVRFQSLENSKIQKKGSPDLEPPKTEKMKGNLMKSGIGAIPNSFVDFNQNNPGFGNDFLVIKTSNSSKKQANSVNTPTLKTFTTNKEFSFKDNSSSSTSHHQPSPQADKVELMKNNPFLCVKKTKNICIKIKEVDSNNQNSLQNDSIMDRKRVTVMRHTTGGHSGNMMYQTEDHSNHEDGKQCYVSQNIGGAIITTTSTANGTYQYQNDQNITSKSNNTLKVVGFQNRTAKESGYDQMNSLMKQIQNINSINEQDSFQEAKIQILSKRQSRQNSCNVSSAGDEDLQRVNLHNEEEDGSILETPYRSRYGTGSKNSSPQIRGSLNHTNFKEVVGTVNYLIESSMKTTSQIQDLSHKMEGVEASTEHMVVMLNKQYATLLEERNEARIRLESLDINISAIKNLNKEAIKSKRNVEFLEQKIESMEEERTDILERYTILQEQFEETTALLRNKLECLGEMKKSKVQVMEASALL